MWHRRHLRIGRGVGAQSVMGGLAAEGRQYDRLAASAGTQETRATSDGHLHQVWTGQLGWQPLLHHLRCQVAGTGIGSPNDRGDNEQRDKERLF